MTSKIFIVFSFVILMGCSSLAYQNCTLGINVEYCLPENLQPIADPQNSFKNALPLMLDNFDKKMLKNENINISDLYVDNELSILWNTILNKVKDDWLKTKELSDDVMRENYDKPWILVDLSDKNNITTKLNEENFIAVAKQSTANLPKEFHEIEIKKKFNELMKEYKLEGLSKSGVYPFIETLYISKIFYDFYSDNNKKVYIIKNTDHRSPFGIIAGDVFIPEKFVKNFSKDELYVVLVHEAFHFFENNKTAIPKMMEQFLTGTANNMLNVFPEKMEKPQIHDAKKRVSEFLDATGTCFKPFTIEPDIDRGVLLYLSSEQQFIYRNLLKSIVNEDEKVRVNLIDMLIKYLENHNKDDFTKEIMHLKIESALLPLRENTVTKEENHGITTSVYHFNFIPYSNESHITNSEKEFIKGYMSLIYGNEKIINEFSNRRTSCFKSM